AEGSALAGNAVYVRCLGEWMACAAQLVPTQVIDQDEDDVGASLRRAAKCAPQGGGAKSHPLPSRRRQYATSCSPTLFQIQGRSRTWFRFVHQVGRYPFNLLCEL